MPKYKQLEVRRQSIGRKRKDSTGRRTRVVDVGDEPQLWANQLPNAQSALDFWRTFLDFRMAGDQSLDATAIARLLTLVRAVSWVESQHGTGSGNQPG